MSFHLPFTSSLNCLSIPGGVTISRETRHLHLLNSQWEGHTRDLTPQNSLTSTWQVYECGFLALHAFLWVLDGKPFWEEPVRNALDICTESSQEIWRAGWVVIDFWWPSNPVMAKSGETSNFGQICRWFAIVKWASGKDREIRRGIAHQRQSVAIKKREWDLRFSWNRIRRGV